MSQGNPTPYSGAVFVEVRVDPRNLAEIVAELIALMNRRVDDGLPLGEVLACVGYGYGVAMRQSGMMVDPKGAIELGLPAVLGGYAAAELEISRQGGARPS